MVCPRRAFIVVIAVAAILTFKAQCSTYLYDGFEAGGLTPTSAQYFSDPSSTNGLNNDSIVRSSTGAADGQTPTTLGFDPTLGWSSTTPMAAGVYPRINDQGLIYPSLATVAGSLDIFRDGYRNGQLIKSVSRSLTDQLAAGARDLYFSSLIQFETGVTGRLRLDEASAQLGFGINSSGSIFIFDDTGTLFNSSAFTLASNVTNLIVFHLGSNNLLDVWVNPSNLATEAGNDATKVASGLTITDFKVGAGMQQVYAQADTGFVTDPDFIFDEDRVASTWQEALPVPEPAEGLLWMATGLTLFGRRKRTLCGLVA